MGLIGRNGGLSISFDRYYARKNTGAMANLGQEGFCVDRDGFYGQTLTIQVAELLAHRDSIATAPQPQLAGLRARQDAFFARMVQRAGLATDTVEEKLDA